MSTRLGSTAKTYISKPVTIRAQEITEEWFTCDHPSELHPRGVIIVPKRQEVLIDTLEGRMTGHVGDFIIEGTEGELYPCKASVLARKYQEISTKEPTP